MRQDAVRILTKKCIRTFINKVVSFMGVGFALYGLANFYQWMSHDPIIKHTVKCPYCRKRISEKVELACSSSLTKVCFTNVGGKARRCETHFSERGTAG